MDKGDASTQIAVGILKAVGVIVLIAAACGALYWGCSHFNDKDEHAERLQRAYDRARYGR